MPDSSTASFTCPVCGSTSHNPNDVAQGYCGNCHNWTGGERMSIWTVYDHPLDYPTGFVARRHAIFPGESRPTTDAVYGGSLEEVRAKIPPQFSTRLSRSPEDEPQIVECWL